MKKIFITTLRILMSMRTIYSHNIQVSHRSDRLTSSFGDFTILDIPS
jgi:hypothetical protein